MVSNSMLLGAIVWSTINYITDVNIAIDVIITKTKRGLANQCPTCNVFNRTGGGYL